MSSQFLSAAVMVAPYTRRETQIDLAGAQTSWPYVRMTMRLMDLFGVTPEVQIDEATDAPTAVIVPRGRYAGTTYAVEPDASAASYFLALAAIHPGSTVTLSGLGSESLQGDARFADVLRKMGCAVSQSEHETTLVGPPSLQGVDADLGDMPDCAQTLAVAALFAVGETTIRGIHTLRVKETDRVAALQTELTKLGADVSVHGEGGGRPRLGDDDHAADAAEAGEHRHLRRPPHGDELRPGRHRPPGRGGRESGVREQDVPGLFRRAGGGDVGGGNMSGDAFNEWRTSGLRGRAKNALLVEASDDVQSTCSLRFDGYAWLEAHDVAGPLDLSNKWLRRFKKSGGLPADEDEAFALSFTLQRGTRDGSVLHHALWYRLWRSVILGTIRLPTPPRWWPGPHMSSCWAVAWERHFLPHLDDAARCVRDVHERIRYDDKARTAYVENEPQPLLRPRRRAK